jgi:nitroimidazol reductase NimA-like FMN-containing flavoprotein (pyridoxamine 5'-phosphate oxidase superfamily)
MSSERTKVKRHPERAAYDRDTVRAILDEAFLCHVAFTVNGQPHVLPTAYGRDGDWIYIHGSAASHMLRSLAEDVEVSVAVTLVDGFVMARSAFKHSLNYRSVVIFGRARFLSDPQEKQSALRTITNHLIPGRWEEVREPSEQEMRQTAVLALPLQESVAKIRTGPPMDTAGDISDSVWGGVVPLRLQAGPALADQHVTSATPQPAPARFERGKRS